MICIEWSRYRKKNRMRWREWKICQTKRLYKPINNSQINHLYSSETLQMFTPSFVYCLTCAYHGRYWNVSYYTNISAFLFSFYSILILLSTLSHSFQCHQFLALWFWCLMHDSSLNYTFQSSVIDAVDVKLFFVFSPDFSIRLKIEIVRYMLCSHELTTHVLYTHNCKFIFGQIFCVFFFVSFSVILFCFSISFKANHSLLQLNIFLLFSHFVDRFECFVFRLVRVNIQWSSAFSHI